MKPPVRVNMISVVKACRNHHVGTISQLKSRLVRPPSTTPPQVRRPGSNPCVDLYFRYPLVERYEDVDSISSQHETLMKQLLPEAWSHNPLTTLKLICNLKVWYGGKHDAEGFYAAAFWLHHNHPKTLASNLVPIAGSFGFIWDVLEILSRVGQRIDDRYYPLTWTRTFRNKNRHSEAQRSKIMRMMRRTSTAKEIRIRETNNNSNNAAENAKEKASALLKRRKGISLANKIVERYNSDPDYRFLHDRVSDLFAECLKHDIQQFNQLQIKQQQRNEQENQESFNLKLEITNAARWCPSINSSVPRPTDLLYESIASNIFPPSESESESKSKSMMRLRKEVLVPLRRALQPAFFGKGGNRWGYAPRNALDREPFASGSAIYKYMLQLSKDIYAKRPATIEAGAVLPHQILSYIVKQEGRMERAAEFQWERMVEDVYRKQGKLKKCLAVCNVNKWKTSGPTAALGLLVSQLSDDPWKGKVVSYSRNPRLHLIQGKGLKSKCKFIMRMEKEDGRLDEVEEVDLVKVFDLILEVAVNEKLKPEQMIDKVFVFIDKYKHRSSTDLGSSCWKNNAGVDYEQLERRFGDKGYKVPHMVIWNMIPMWNELPFCSREPGVTLLSGLEDYSDHLVKSFLDNEGEMGPEQVMEAAISRQDYQTVAVVD